MYCKYCDKDRPERYFYKVESRGKQYLRKMCSVCISNQKKAYYLKKQEEAQNGR